MFCSQLRHFYSLSLRKILTGQKFRIIAKNTHIQAHNKMKTEYEIMMKDVVNSNKLRIIRIIIHEHN